MSFGDNTHIISGATLNAVAPNGTNDPIANDSSDSQATAFAFTGNAGDDSIETFGRNDTVLNFQKIFDGNNDGIIDFGPNGILDISRTTKTTPGADQITLVGLASKQLRYLGSKEGYYAYADASVRSEAFTHANDLALGGGHTGKEGTVGSETIDASKGSVAILYDTALGLNLGGDTIKGFGSDDLLVTTSAIFNGNDGGVEITFGRNKVLDLSGEVANTMGDDGAAHGGQIAFTNSTVTGTVGHGLYLEYTYTSVDGDPTTNDVTYYYYGTTAPTVSDSLHATA